LNYRHYLLPEIK